MPTQRLLFILDAHGMNEESGVSETLCKPSKNRTVDDDGALLRCNPAIAMAAMQPVSPATMEPCRADGVN